MDDGFVLILAIIVFSVFRNFISEAKKKGARPDPDSFDTSAEHDEAQDRALDALRQWEAKQRALQAGSGDMDPPRREPVRIPRPGEHRTDVRLPAPRRMQQPAARRRARPVEQAESHGAEQTESQRAEQARREAYNAIRDLLSGKTRRPSPPVRTVPAPSQVPAPSRSAAPERIRERTTVLRPRIQGTIRRREEPEKPVVQPRQDRREQDRTVPARLDRLDSLPPVARGIVYAELLGKPVAFREPREGGGD